MGVDAGLGTFRGGKKGRIWGRFDMASWAVHWRIREDLYSLLISYLFFLSFFLSCFIIYYLFYSFILSFPVYVCALVDAKECCNLHFSALSYRFGEKRYNSALQRCKLVWTERDKALGFPSEKLWNGLIHIRDSQKLLPQVFGMAWRRSAWPTRRSANRDGSTRQGGAKQIGSIYVNLYKSSYQRSTISICRQILCPDMPSVYIIYEIIIIIECELYNMYTCIIMHYSVYHHTT